MSYEISHFFISLNGLRVCPIPVFSDSNVNQNLDEVWRLHVWPSPWIPNLTQKLSWAPDMDWSWCSFPTRRAVTLRIPPICKPSQLEFMGNGSFTTWFMWKTNLLKALYITFVNYPKNVPLSKCLVFFLRMSLSMLKLNNIPMVHFWNDFSKEKDSFDKYVAHLQLFKIKKFL